MQARPKTVAKRAASVVNSDVVFDSKQWRSVAFIREKQLSRDTFFSIFQYRDKDSCGSQDLGLEPANIFTAAFTCWKRCLFA